MSHSSRDCCTACKQWKGGEWEVRSEQAAAGSGAHGWLDPLNQHCRGASRLQQPPYLY
jgi:hypothetical protein